MSGNIQEWTTNGRRDHIRTARRGRVLKSWLVLLALIIRRVVLFSALLTGTVSGVIPAPYVVVTNVVSRTALIGTPLELWLTPDSHVVYVRSWSGFHEYLTILNVSNPNNPTQLGELSYGDLGSFFIMQFSRSRTVGFITPTRALRVAVLDFRTPQVPKLIGYLNTTHDVVTVITGKDEHLVYLGTVAGFLIAYSPDVYTSPPEPIGFLPTEVSVKDIVLTPDEEFAYLDIGEFGGTKVAFVNISDPEQPIVIETFPGVSVLRVSDSGQEAVGEVFPNVGVLLGLNPPVAISPLVRFPSNTHLYWLDGKDTVVSFPWGGCCGSILDVTHPANVRTIGQFSGAYIVRLISNPTASVVYATSSKGVLVIRLQKLPLQPGNITAFPPVSNVYCMLRSEDETTVFARTSNSVLVGNLTRPESPVPVAPILEGEFARDLALSSTEKRLYVATTRGLLCVDVSDPANPTTMGQLDTDGEVAAVTLSQDRALAYIVVFQSAIHKGTDRFIVADISNPEHPKTLGQTDIPLGSAPKITVSPTEKVACVIDLDVSSLLLDISEPANLSLLSPLKLRKPTVVAFGKNGSLLYVGTNGDGLYSINVNNPGQAIQTVAGGMGYIVAVLVNTAGSLVYAVDFYRGVMIAKTDSPNLELTGQVEIHGINAVAINQAETLLYLVGTTGLFIADVSIPSKPRILHSATWISTTTNTLILEITASLSRDEGMLYVTDPSTARVHIIRVHQFAVGHISEHPLEVGVGWTGVLQFVNASGHAKQASNVGFRHVHPDGHVVPQPYWLGYDSTTQTLSGVPGKEATGKLTLEVTPTLEGSGVSAPLLLYLDVQPTLRLVRQHDGHVHIDTPSELITLKFTLPSAETGEFILENFGAVSVSFDNKVGQLRAVGATEDINGMLQRLRLNLHLKGDETAEEKTVHVHLSDNINLPQYDSVPLSVFKPNRPPHVNVNIGRKSVKVGQVFDFVLPLNTIEDPDGDVLLFGVTLSDGNPLPHWLTFDPQSRRLYGVAEFPRSGGGGISESYREVLVVKVTGSDQFEKAAVTFDVEVSDYAPYVQELIPNQLVKPKHNTVFRIASSTFSDPDDTLLTYKATLSHSSSSGKGGGGLPGWLRFDELSRQFFVDNPNQEGSWDITVSATDSAGKSTNTTFTLYSKDEKPVVHTDKLPSSEQLTIKSMHPFELLLDNDLFTDADDTTLKYSATLGASDERLPPWLTFDESHFRLHGTPHREDQGKSYEIKLSATDGFTEASTTVILTVRKNHPPTAPSIQIGDQHATIGAEYSFLVRGFEDVDGDALHYSAKQLITGEELTELPRWLMFDERRGVLSGKPDAKQVFTVVLTATDPAGEAATKQFDIDVDYAKMEVLLQLISDFGPGLTALGIVYKLYVHRGPIRNFMVGKKYRHQRQRGGGTVQRFTPTDRHGNVIPRERIKELVAVRQRNTVTIMRRLLGWIPNHYVQQFVGYTPLPEGRLPRWMTYDPNSNEIVADTHNAPPDEVVVMVKDYNGFILEEFLYSTSADQHIGPSQPVEQENGAQATRYRNSAPVSHNEETHNPNDTTENVSITSDALFYDNEGYSPSSSSYYDTTFTPLPVMRGVQPLTYSVPTNRPYLAPQSHPYLWSNP